ncbi:MAG: hypothetical protein MJ184_10020, partial [Treponema sp.]|uniref:hypothetical protein n=1 Tax=Treponema sp. TaxID=166 RepID=UPI00298D9FD3
ENLTVSKSQWIEAGKARLETYFENPYITVVFAKIPNTEKEMVSIVTMIEYTVAVYYTILN